MGILAFILWVGSMAVCGSVAGEKRREVIGWVLLAFFIGPIAAIVLLCLPKLSPAQAGDYYVGFEAGPTPAIKSENQLPDLDELEKLGRLRSSGVISETEFEDLKARALGTKDNKAA